MGGSRESVRNRFLAALPKGVDGEAIFTDMTAEYDGEELERVAVEIVETATAGCTADEFQNWSHDHLEFIIDMAHEHGFSIPPNLLNGLPKQLQDVVDTHSLRMQGCPDVD